MHFGPLSNWDPVNWPHLAQHRDKHINESSGSTKSRYLYNKTNQMHQFHKFILSWKSTCFRQFICPSSGVYSLHTQQWYVIQVCRQLLSRIRMELCSIIKKFVTMHGHINVNPDTFGTTGGLLLLCHYAWQLHVTTWSKIVPNAVTDSLLCNLTLQSSNVSHCSIWVWKVGSPC